MNPSLPNRQSIRKRGWDYTRAGWYFVTINTRKSQALFGVVVNGRMVLSEMGRMAEGCWREIPKHFPHARVDEHVIMPNHMHGLIELIGGEQAIASGRAIARPYTLGDVVGAYKAAVSREIGRGGQLPARAPAAGASPIWHRNYWDVIVQDAQALANIRHYIRLNPQNYEAVMKVGEPRMLGNAALLDMPKMGFLASRGEARPHGQLPLKAGEAIISGFLSPMERAVFKAGLEHKRALIWVVPFGVGLTRQALPRQAPAVRRAIDAGLLLMVSPFSDDIDAPSVRRAAWCNHYVLAHCDRMVIGHLNPGGMLLCILSEADPDLEITCL